MWYTRYMMLFKTLLTPEDKIGWQCVIRERAMPKKQKNKTQRNTLLYQAMNKEQLIMSRWNNMQWVYHLPHSEYIKYLWFHICSSCLTPPFGILWEQLPGHTASVPQCRFRLIVVSMTHASFYFLVMWDTGVCYNGIIQRPVWILNPDWSKGGH